MAEERVQPRLAAILAEDVAGYSRLIGEDEEGTLAALTAHRTEMIEPSVAEYLGHGPVPNLLRGGRDGRSKDGIGDRGHWGRRRQLGELSGASCARPLTVAGTAVGGPLNMIAVIAVYAMICRSWECRCGFPASPVATARSSR